MLILFVVMYLFDVWRSDIHKVGGSICCNSFLNPYLWYQSSIPIKPHETVFLSFYHFVFLSFILSVLLSFRLSVFLCFCLSASSIVDCTGRYVQSCGLRWSKIIFVHLIHIMSLKVNLFSLFKAICQTDGWDWMDGWDSYHRS